MIIQELKAARRQKKQDQATKDQIKQMKAMVEDMKESENASTQASRIFDNFNDRFDEVLAAINNTEKRLDFGSKSGYQRRHVRLNSLQMIEAYAIEIAI